LGLSPDQSTLEIDYWMRNRQSDFLAERVRQWAVREALWLERLINLRTWPILFICGARHIDRFVILLREANIDALVAEFDWTV
jgi:hypothetical protein